MNRDDEEFVFLWHLMIGKMISAAGAMLGNLMDEEIVGTKVSEILSDVVECEIDINKMENPNESTMKKNSIPMSPDPDKWISTDNSEDQIMFMKKISLPSTIKVQCQRLGYKEQIYKKELLRILESLIRQDIIMTLFVVSTEYYLGKAFFPAKSVIKEYTSTDFINPIFHIPQENNLETDQTYFVILDEEKLSEKLELYYNHWMVNQLKTPYENVLPMEKQIEMAKKQISEIIVQYTGYYTVFPLEVEGANFHLAYYALTKQSYIKILYIFRDEKSGRVGYQMHLPVYSKFFDEIDASDLIEGKPETTITYQYDTRKRQLMLNGQLLLFKTGKTANVVREIFTESNVDKVWKLVDLHFLYERGSDLEEEEQEAVITKMIYNLNNRIEQNVEIKECLTIDREEKTVFFNRKYVVKNINTGNL